MKMLLVGTGAVGESMLRIIEKRDPKREWLEKAVLANRHIERAEQVYKNLGGGSRYVPEQLDANDKDAIVALIRKHDCDLVMDAAVPDVANHIFDAAFEAGAHYVNMGTYSMPLEKPLYGYGLHNSFETYMAEYNFEQHDKWKEKGLMAVIGLGIDPGVVDVFAKFAAEYLFDELKEIHVRDGGNLEIPGADADDVAFGFNVWTVLDECLNPNVEWSREKGFFCERPFAGEEVFEMPLGIGANTVVKVEHEEVVLMPRHLAQYGLEKVDFKIALDPSLIRALKVIEKLGLRGLDPVTVDGKEVIPRDLVAYCAPQPKDLGDEMIGMMCVGIHCVGKKDGLHREIFMYQPLDNQKAIEKCGMQAVVAQTGYGAAIGLELIAKGVWKDAGVFGPEYFDAIPYIKLMDQYDFEYGIVEMESPYKQQQDRAVMKEIFAEAERKKF